MKHMKIIIVPAQPETTKTVVDKTACDLCGADVSLDEKWYETNSVQIERATGHNGPYGGSTRTELYDLCANCCDTKLMPWLASQGAKPTVTEVDW